MDKTPPHIETETLLNHAIAECESLKAQLEEYRYVIIMRDREIDNLKMQMAEKTQSRSNFDNREDELRLLQDSIHLLKNRGTGMPEGYEGQSSSAEFELEGKQQQIIYLQTQIADLQEQLSEVNNRNLLLQQEASRIGELEDLFERTARELEELKNGGLPEGE
jgi:chromosome segregation ATPase